VIFAVFFIMVVRCVVFYNGGFWWLWFCLFVVGFCLVLVVVVVVVVVCVCVWCVWVVCVCGGGCVWGVCV